MWFVLIFICCCFILFDAWYYIRFGVICFIYLLSKKRSLFEESVMYGKYININGRQLKSTRVSFISRVLWIIIDCLHNFMILNICLPSWLFANMSDWIFFISTRSFQFSIFQALACSRVTVASRFCISGLWEQDIDYKHPDILFYSIQNLIFIFEHRG